MLFDIAQTAIASHSARFAVVGLNSNSLQRCRESMRCGFKVFGFDLDATRSNDWARSNFFPHCQLKEVIEELLACGFEATRQPERSRRQTF